MPDDQRRVFSVVGMLPEPGGYAVAKFSRSARPYKEWAIELTQEGASRFYEQFYFAYGHASIADLAHLTMVAENISIVAAVEVLDEPLVDAQESSTRYQDFSRRRYCTPPEIAASPLLERYRQHCDLLFDAYHAAHRAVTEHFERIHASRRPADLPEDEYRRILRARAFDVARYLLPSSTYTGLGYLCSARTLERQIGRLAAHPLAEMREIAEELRRATTEPAYNPLAMRLAPELDAFMASHRGPDMEAFVDKMRAATWDGDPAAPTLVRYTQPRRYAQETYESARERGRSLLGALQPDGSRGVQLVGPTSPPLELAATLLYRVTDPSLRQILDALAAIPSSEIDAIGALANARRGPHDELVREARVGYQLIFDVCMDNGAFRDLHRHRNCVQVIKDFHPTYGYDEPPPIREAGLQHAYRSAMDRAGALAIRLDELQPGLGQYVLPLAYRRRALFKMDAAELAYIAEVRTRPSGHFSYREIAHRMYAEFQQRYPSLAAPIRITDPSIEDFFER